jgi:general nucleoside transport system ATP-binding protein
MSNLHLAGITKRFGSFLANDDISLSVNAGSIHGLLGENGAGKSTLMNILSGLHQPDSGQIYLDDRLISIASPADAIRQGIGMIHQHFMLVPQLSVTENIILGDPLRASRRTRTFRLNLIVQAEAIAQMSQDFGLEVPPHVRVEDLPVGIQQRVEILKVLYRQAKILILDEPTAVLTPPEASALLNILRQLAASNHTIIFISHKLDEIMAVCDAVTVLRRGRVVTSLKTSDVSRSQLAYLMVDRPILPHQRPAPQSPGKVVLDIKNLWVNTDRQIAAIRQLSLQVRSGEIVGIAGVDGNGQRELADAIARLLPIQQGTIVIHDDSEPSAKDRPILAYIPEDRQKQGLVLSFSIARNLILKAFTKLPFCQWFVLQNKAIAAHANIAIRSFDIRADNSKLKVSQLSGGNQQKVILARELDGEPALIIAMQPTRGLDIGATEAVHQSLLQQRSRGAAILYISTELEDVMTISDRLMVMYGGQVMATLDARTATLEQIGLLMTGDNLSRGLHEHQSP